MIKTDVCILLIKGKNVFDKNNEILEKVSNIIKIKFDSTPVLNKKYLKIDAKEGFQCFYASFELFDSVYRKDENCYLKVFLENYNFNVYVEIYSDEEYSNESDEKI